MPTKALGGTMALAGRGLTALALVFIGLFVGVSCVILPTTVPFAIVGLAGLILLWTLPDLKRVPARLSYWSLYIFTVSSLSVPAYFAIILPGLPWISLRRLALFTFLGCFVLTMSASSAMRAKASEVARSNIILLYCTGGYFLLQLATCVVSARPLDSLNFMINTSMTWWIPLLAAIVLIRDDRDIRRVAYVILICMIFDMAMGMIETKLHRPFLIYMLPAAMRNQMIQSFPMYAAMLEGSTRNGIYRAISTYNVALSWGEMAAMTSPIAAYFLSHGKSIWQRSFGIAALLASFYSIFMSGSRGAYVGGLAAMITYFALWSIRHMRLKPQSLTGGITLVLYSMFSVAAVLSVFFVGRIHRVVLGGGEVQASNEGRNLEWALAWPKIYASPIWGHGAGTAADVVGFTNQSGNPSLDSYLINVLVDTGVLGLVLFCGMFIGAIIFSFKLYIFERSETSSIAGALGCSLMSFTIYRITLSQTENNSLAFILVGLIFVLCHICSRSLSEPREVASSESRQAKVTSS